MAMIPCSMSIRQWIRNNNKNPHIGYEQTSLFYLHSSVLYHKVMKTHQLLNLYVYIKGVKNPTHVQFRIGNK